jgi:hypothetical protein
MRSTDFSQFKEPERLIAQRSNNAHAIKTKVWLERDAQSGSVKAKSAIRADSGRLAVAQSQ